MNLKDIKDLADGLEEKQSNAIMGLIDKKVDNDMEKVLNAMHLLKSSIEHKIDSVETKLETKIDAVEKSLKSEVSNTTRMLWYFIGAIIVAIAAAIGSKWLGH